MYLRKVPGAEHADSRFANAFKDVPTDKWTAFGDPSEISVK